VNKESLPSVQDVRSRIETVENPQVNYALRYAYLIAGRISEVVGTSSPGDTSTARGPKKSDVRFDVVDGHETVLFTVYTAKRDGMERIVALPCEFEPWAKPMAEYFSKANSSVFPFTRQHVSKYVLEHNVFSDWKYPILKYSVKKGELRETVPNHWNPFRLHAIRHLRATELVRFYHFKAEDLAAYCGWKLQTLDREVSSVMERYIDLAWQSYYGKLLRPREG
jgi:hypothetical protein